MITLTPNESRALGVLIEKAATTPEQYPLSLNALAAGSNQKNNRDPVLALTDDEVYDAAEALREKQLAVRVDTIGSRVHKYRHSAGDVFRCKAGELAVLAELLLRGPQTLGELRGRASRMVPAGGLATLEDVKVMIRGLSERETPLVKEIPPAPGSRAERYVQLLCPDLHPITSSAAPASAPSQSPAAGGATGLADRVATLEREVVQLRAALQKLAAAVGEPDPLSAAEVEPQVHADERG